jgi:peptidyl-prolyl cis-trans isomerase SurA
MSRINLSRIALAASLSVGLTTLATTSVAQNLFAPAILVNDSVITQFELTQRGQLISLLQPSGNERSEARRALIDDRLKLTQMAEAGLNIAPEDVQLGIEDMATSAQMTADQFLQALGQNGVEPQTVRDFIRVGIGWGELVRGRFLARARPSDDEIDRALAQTERGSVQVRLGEVIIPVNAETADKVDVVAQKISAMTDPVEFSEAAQRYSVSPTAQDGGATDWLPINNLPQNLRSIVLTLRVNGVSDPIVLGNAVGLFQLRGIREVSGSSTDYASIDYAVMLSPVDGLKRSQAEMLQTADGCDDLYGYSTKYPQISISRNAVAPNNVPRDIALVLAGLDAGETAVMTPVQVQIQDQVSADAAPDAPRPQMLRAVMLCSRTASVSADSSREEVAQALTLSRLTALSEQFLEQLRADAVIVDK